MDIIQKDRLCCLVFITMVILPKNIQDLATTGVDIIIILYIDIIFDITNVHFYRNRNDFDI